MLGVQRSDPCRDHRRASASSASGSSNPVDARIRGTALCVSGARLDASALAQYTDGADAAAILHTTAPGNSSAASPNAACAMAISAHAVFSDSGAVAARLAVHSRAHNDSAAAVITGRCRAGIRSAVHSSAPAAGDAASAVAASRSGIFDGRNRYRLDHARPR